MLGVDMSIDIGIIVMATPAITLAFVVGVSRAVNMLDVTTVIDVGMLADENANRLAAVMTPLEFTLPAP